MRIVFIRGIIVGDIVTFFLYPARVKNNYYISRSLRTKIIYNPLKVTISEVIGFKCRIRISSLNAGKLNKESGYFFLHVIKRKTCIFYQGPVTVSYTHLT